MRSRTDDDDFQRYVNLPFSFRCRSYINRESTVAFCERDESFVICFPHQFGGRLACIKSSTTRVKVTNIVASFIELSCFYFKALVDVRASRRSSSFYIDQSFAALTNN